LLKVSGEVARISSFLSCARKNDDDDDDDDDEQEKEETKE
jgi:hypothetical protein